MTENGRYQPLAAISFNICLFISNDFAFEAKFKLRPLQPEINQCTLTFFFSSFPLLNKKLENFHITEKNDDELNLKDKSDSYKLSKESINLVNDDNIIKDQKQFNEKFLFSIFFFI